MSETLVGKTILCRWNTRHDGAQETGGVVVASYLHDAYVCPGVSCTVTQLIIRTADGVIQHVSPGTIVEVS